MSPIDVKKNLISRVVSMGPHQRLAYAIFCAERAAPNYAHFSSEYGWGNYAAIRASIDFAWECLLKGECDRTKAVSLQILCRDIAPETEDFPFDDASFALDAASICEILMIMIVDGGQSHDEEIVGISIDTLYMRVSSRVEDLGQDADLEEIVQHCVFSSEIEVHDGVINFLSRDECDLHEFERKWRGNRISNIGYKVD